MDSYCYFLFNHSIDLFYFFSLQIHSLVKMSNCVLVYLFACWFYVSISFTLEMEVGQKSPLKQKLKCSDFVTITYAFHLFNLIFDHIQISCQH